MTIDNSDKIRVALVDDSSIIRGILARTLTTDPSIEIVASVSNGELGVHIAESKKPDILILDVEMPVMDGITALPLIIKASPKTKVIMCSTLTEKGADITLKAMALGAVETIAKPSNTIETGSDSAFKARLIQLVKSLASHVAHRTQNAAPARDRVATTPISTALKPKMPVILRNDTHAYKGRPDILAIGSSTGGPNALFKVVKDLKNIDIPIVITQHMPKTFTKVLAQHITDQTGIETFEGEEGMTVERGKAYVAPGGMHMVFRKDGMNVKIKLDDGPPENFCKPAVDVMLRSLISIYGKKVLCAILTGMGSDGLKGAQELAGLGGRIIAQDEKTSIVWGMPGAVAQNQLCSAVLPLEGIGPWLMNATK
ncbi:MAG: chemotaxis response regulator protein-glutamate methylesterase [Alphaproteobacteria bacterium]|nr:chemotaxis response regulator protein-glutamate methylesterase [Alphaproteobacteria bacterium]